MYNVVYASFHGILKFIFLKIIYYLRMRCRTSDMVTSSGGNNCVSWKHKRLNRKIRLPLFDGSVAPNHDGVNAPFRRFRWRSMVGCCFIQINCHAGDEVFAIVLCAFRV